MRIQNNSSFLDVSVSHGCFKMAAQVKLENLLVAYAILGLIIVIGWYRRIKNGM